MLTERFGTGGRPGSPDSVPLTLAAAPRGVLAPHNPFPHRLRVAQVPPIPASYICGFNKLWTLWHRVYRRC